MKNKAIGIIGGMGPEASEEFYRLLTYHAQKNYAAEKNEDFPEIYLSSIPFPYFINNEKKKLTALNMLIHRVKEMNKLPIGFFCMACNTGHLLLGDLQKVTDKPFVSLLVELPKYLKGKKIKKVGILATPTTIRSKMYEKTLKQYGIELITPNSEDTEKLGKIILDIVAGRNKEKNLITVKQIAHKLLKQDAEGIIEGCTEIPLIFPKQHIIPMYNTLEILALAVLKKYYEVQ